MDLAHAVEFLTAAFEAKTVKPADLKKQAEAFESLAKAIETKTAGGDCAEFPLLVNLLKSAFDQLGAGHVNLDLTLNTIRILLRSEKLRSVVDNEELNTAEIAKRFNQLTYCETGVNACERQLLDHLVSILGKLSSRANCGSKLLESGIVESAIYLLSAGDLDMVQGVLQMLALLLENCQRSGKVLCLTTVIDVCLQLLKNADLVTQKLSCNVLRLLFAAESDAREQAKVYDGLAILLNALSVKNVRLQWQAIWAISQLADDADCCMELGQLGAIPLVVACLNDHVNAANETLDVIKWDELLPTLSGFCAVLSQFCVREALAREIVQSNGPYVVGCILLTPEKHADVINCQHYLLLEAAVLRIWRQLFSYERNRQMFKRVFSAPLLEEFVDLGHSCIDLEKYIQLAKKFDAYRASDLNAVRDAIHELNRSRSPLFTVQTYEILEVLGSGAFGCVYKVRKIGDHEARLYAMKEIFPAHVQSDDKSIGEIIQEVNIIRQHLRHPNVVRYRRVFTENGKLYIVMDLIAGTSLRDHIHATKEKGLKFGEDRIWHVVVQAVLALRYLHKEKQIWHRDLNPNNVLLGDQDKVFIADFGLAKQRPVDASKMNSVVGTMLYNCPEMIQNQPYNEKADIWSFGCIVYEMCMLQPAFHCSNVLQLAKKVVSADFESIPDDQYSANLIEFVKRCLTVDPEKRPDVIALATLIPDLLLVHIDSLNQQNALLKKKLDQEKSNRLSSDHSPNSLLSPGTSWSSSNVSSLSQSTFNAKRLRWSQNSATLAAAEDEGNVSKAPSKTSRSRSVSAKGAQLRNVPVEPPSAAVSVQSRIHSAANQKRIPAEPLKLPQIRRTYSAGILDGQRRNQQPQQRGVRISSATVRIASASLKPIADPILDLLAVLHRLMMVTDPAVRLKSHSVDHRRRIADYFRRYIFGPESNSEKIKLELRKLSSRSPEIVQHDLGMKDFYPLCEQLGFEKHKRKTAWYTSSEGIPFLTYDQLFAVIMSLWEDMYIGQSTANQSQKLMDSRLMTPLINSLL